MDVGAFIESVRQDPAYAGQIVHVHTQPARPPAFAPLPDGLHPATGPFLAALGVSQVYRHQAEAIEAAGRGEDVLITTGPASGKSLCYQVPILQSFLADPGATALLLFPTKALARDQIAAWNKGIAALVVRPSGRGPEEDGLKPALQTATAVPFDADASRSDRASAHATGRFVVTNPEMLHVSLLPGHGRWARLLQGLKFVVLDEVHTYTGFFGANMANVLRRLDRVCRHYGSRPQFICSSATVGNPLEMAERVTGRRLRHVADDASGAGSRTYVFWNPPREGEAPAEPSWLEARPSGRSSEEYGLKPALRTRRRSANVEAHELMVKLLLHGIPTICFSKARNTAELLYRYLRETLQKESPALADRVVPYRGGYSGKERREMERRLREGEVIGVSATRALELGIDVGALDACIVIGYPGWLHSLFQQWGRAGRAGRDCLCILVGTDTLINQYVMQHPEYVFGRPLEAGIVDHENPFVVIGHVRCATAELPVAASETRQFGYAADLALEVLEEKQKVRRIGDAWYHASPEPPAHEVRLRGYGDESTVILDADTEKVIDRVDKFRALRIFYPGAIYFHRGDTYEMIHHDFDRNVVRVHRVDVPYYTDPYSGTAVNHVDQILDHRQLGIGEAYLGEVFAVLNTDIYRRIRFYTLDAISSHATHVPPVAYDAMSFWVIPPVELAREAARRGLNPEDGMRGILYCTSRVLPLFLTSDANDFDWSLGSRNTPWHTMFWYEFYLRGIGHAEQCYERVEEILKVALEQLLACDCEDGCPNCTSRLITPYHVRNVELGEGTVHSRRTAVVLLNSLLTGQSVDESLALLDSPRARRGMEFLPSVTGFGATAGSRATAGLPSRASTGDPESGTVGQADRGTGEARSGEPTVAQREPHRLPLDGRTRQLLARKIDRACLPKLPVDHPVDPMPPVGIPTAREGEAPAEPSPRIPGVRRTADSPSPAAAIRHAGDPLVRRLLSKLKARAAKSPQRVEAGREEVERERVERGAQEQEKTEAPAAAPSTLHAPPSTAVPSSLEPRPSGLAPSSPPGSAPAGPVRLGDPIASLARHARRKKPQSGT